jgi:crotonobetainyl-CoA:carnitine CoA-transferase CaiB-like acyl-CoA transferase
MNRNKRSLTLNLKHPKGREVFLAMAEKADVVTQNFRVGVVDKLGVGYEDCRKRNPKIVYASVSGFGPKGPDAKDGVYDILGQARGGLMASLSIFDPEPTYRPNGGLADQMGAVTLAYGVLCGLMARERKGVGQHVEVSQLGGQLILQALAINGYLLNGDRPVARSRQSAGNPLFGIYRCKGDLWIALGCIQPDRYWPAVCEVLGIQHLQHDPKYRDHPARLANANELAAILNEIFCTRTREEWTKALKAKGVLCTPVQRYEDLPNDPQIIANEYFTEMEHPTGGKMVEVGIPVKLSATPGRVRGPAPEFGQHTEEVLQEFGYSWEDIERFRTEKVV